MTSSVALDIVKGYQVPLASDTLELPSTEDILDRARGMAYEHQLSHAVGLNVPELVLAGLEVFSPFEPFPNQESSEKLDYTNNCSGARESTKLYSYNSTRRETLNIRPAACRNTTGAYLNNTG
jgi:hypothetical protein